MTMKLLIVDDSELIRTRLVGLIDGIPGIEAIHTADTLAQPLESVRRVSPTLVILDLHLSDGNSGCGSSHVYFGKHRRRLNPQGGDSEIMIKVLPMFEPLPPNSSHRINWDRPVISLAS